MEFDVKTYLMVISLSGGIILLIFMIMAFCNVENFNIKKGKGTSSGIIILLASIVKHFLISYINLVLFLCCWRLILHD